MITTAKYQCKLEKKMCKFCKTAPCRKSSAVVFCLLMNVYNYLAVTYALYEACPSVFSGNYSCDFPPLNDLNTTEIVQYTITFGSLLYEIMWGIVLSLCIVSCMLRKCQPKMRCNCNLKETDFNEFEKAIRPVYVVYLIFVMILAPFGNAGTLSGSWGLKATAILRLVFYCSVIAVPIAFVYPVNHDCKEIVGKSFKICGKLALKMYITSSCLAIFLQFQSELSNKEELRFIYLSLILLEGFLTLYIHYFYIFKLYIIAKKEEELSSSILYYLRYFFSCIPEREKRIDNRIKTSQRVVLIVTTLLDLSLLITSIIIFVHIHVHISEVEDNFLFITSILSLALSLVFPILVNIMSCINCILKTKERVTKCQNFLLTPVQICTGK